MVMTFKSREQREPANAIAGTAIEPPEDQAFTADAVALAADINTAWRETPDGIFKTGDLLIKAKAAVGHGNWLKYVKQHLPFDRATARRLIAIARDTKLRNEAHVTHLPPCWPTLLDLTTTTQEQFERGIRDGLIHPGMLRVDVERVKGRWVPGEISSPRFRDDGKSMRRRQQAGPDPDPIKTAREVYFDLTCELSADAALREGNMCWDHFRAVARENEVDDGDDE